MTDSDRPKTSKSTSAKTDIEAPSAVKATRLGKSIFLFADGTGNSSAKLFKTNVWRMYEAIDFGLASPGKHVQIAYYDNGVGTSNFRPLRMLGGIFGIGLARNVRRLYAFLCRNYQPNDRIYCFGFSRGAFTIRILVGLITSQGILNTNGETALSYQIQDVYREFRRQFLPNRLPAQWLVSGLRWLRDGVVAVKRTIMRQTRYCDLDRVHTDVEFVGVWDTVAAYGGPITELTRGIDDWVYPLTMPHYGLSAKVRRARHALSLDDERDAFHPFLWDEVREDDVIANGEHVPVSITKHGKDETELRIVAEDRLKQVWFAGVHSDVGGGYPDESLSYVSLLWMMDELSPNTENPDVDFVDDFVRRARDLANPYGPIHDSRAGFGAYYRYQPRKIAAMLDPPSIKTLFLRDPEVDAKPISGGKRKKHGLLKCVCVHESALARITSGIDNYAPSALPATFTIENADGPRASAMLTQDHRQMLAAAAPSGALREDHQENAWNLVWRRRIVYFLSFGLTLILLGLPILKPVHEVEKICGDDRCFADWMVDKALFFVPEGTRNLLHPWTQMPIVVLLLLAVIAALILFGKRSENRFRDRVRSIWRDYLAGTLPTTVPRSRLRRFRESAAYQHFFHFMKWRLFPTVLGILTLIFLIYGATIIATQTLYAFAEPRNLYCKDRAAGAAPAHPEGVRFRTDSTCTDLMTSVEAGKTYEVQLTVGEEWKDLNFPSRPDVGVVNRPPYMRMLSPLKRVTRANWLQPVTQVREHDPEQRWRRWLTPVLGPRIDMRESFFTRKSDKAYAFDFCPARKGDLYLMVNDAAPLLTPFNYWNNKGTAQVSVRATGRICDPNHS